MGNPHIFYLIYSKNDFPFLGFSVLKLSLIVTPKSANDLNTGNFLPNGYRFV